LAFGATKRGNCGIMRRKNITTRMMKNYIVQGLLILMSKKSFETISISEITEKAGVDRSTYYRNFKSKEDIIRFFVKKVWHEYMLTYDKAVSFKDHLKKLLMYYIKYKKEFLLIYKHGLTHLILDELNDFFKPISEDKNLSIEERYKIYWYAGAIYNSVLLWFSTGMKESPDKLSEMHVALIPSAADREFLIQPFLFHKELL
jgi:AcrR family transcriptional regulator